jgi:GGDEF domain-containing protein
MPAPDVTRPGTRLHERRDEVAPFTGVERKSAADLLRDADIAMYRAKRTERTAA